MTKKQDNKKQNEKEQDKQDTAEAIAIKEFSKEQGEISEISETINEANPSDVEKQMNHTLKLILITLIIVIIAATLALVYYQDMRYKTYYFEYNGFPVHKVRQGNLDVYQIEVGVKGQKAQLTMRNNPKELETIPVENSENVLNKAFGKNEIYITMPANATSVSVIAATEISKITGNPYVLNKPIPTQGAMTSLVEGKNLTVKTCADANENTAIIELRRGDENRIYAENDCVVIEGKSENDFVKSAERLSLTLIGVIKQ